VGRRAIPGETDLATTHPELAAELVDQSLATRLRAGSDRKVEWQCAVGHRWFAVVQPRCAKGVGCPYCSGRVPVIGETDLATTHPAVAAELVDQSLATSLKATSARKVEWQCAVGHRWITSSSGRTASGAGCPYCAGQRAIPGETDLATTNPALAKELVDRTLATTLMAGSHRRVGWECRAGHRWDAVVSSRAISGRGCPYCAGQRAIPGETDLATTHPALAKELVDRTLATTLMAGTNRKVEWQCAVGHRWLVAPNNRTAKGGTGCPECAPLGFSPESAAWLYLLSMPGGLVLKYGITNDLDTRLDKHRRQGFAEVVETHYFDVGADALAAESRIKQHARAQGWRPPLSAASMPYGGATETLSAHDVGEGFTLSGLLAELD
jgi:hypothetical protein